MGTEKKRGVAVPVKASGPRRTVRRRLLRAIGFVVFALLAPVGHARPQERSGHARPKAAAQQPAKLLISDDVVAHALTLRLGPLNLPAKTEQAAMLQAPELFWTIPVDGWLISFAAQLVDQKGHALPKSMLQQITLRHTGRSDFLCPNKEEQIYAADSEMYEWPALHGYGYAVKRGDRIRVNAAVQNSTAAGYPQSFLEIRVGYQTHARGSAPQALQDVFPVWLDVQQCDDSVYELNPGLNVRSGQFQFMQAGSLLGLRGHLRNFGRRIEVADQSRDTPVARLEAQLDSEGRVLSMPIVDFQAVGGYKIASGARLRVTVLYQNPTGRTLPAGATGIAVGYFVPDDAKAMLAFRRPAKR